MTEKRRPPQDGEYIEPTNSRRSSNARNESPGNSPKVTPIPRRNTNYNFSGYHSPIGLKRHVPVTDEPRGKSASTSGETSGDLNKKKRGWSHIAANIVGGAIAAVACLAALGLLVAAVGLTWYVAWWAWSL